ncbi:hypothetical protein K402DRAFT_393010 [Aulographum hederae CBS 113979]|uniref:Uncharacterized protein n=1 Tax=Aulographum hederae CBS 113979 TaxID=1176131 RepID=A0A6G1H2S8_9PEZI|nr:hypothetical protein K402DRAFT_393010 [Aulographum hederae CBS 113979]
MLLAYSGPLLRFLQLFLVLLPATNIIFQLLLLFLEGTNVINQLLFPFLSSRRKEEGGRKKIHF